VNVIGERTYLGATNPVNECDRHAAGRRAAELRLGHRCAQNDRPIEAHPDEARNHSFTNGAHGACLTSPDGFLRGRCCAVTRR
jgi:hypothetical protein